MVREIILKDDRYFQDGLKIPIDGDFTLIFGEGAKAILNYLEMVIERDESNIYGVVKTSNGGGIVFTPGEVIKKTEQRFFFCFTKRYPVDFLELRSLWTREFIVDRKVKVKWKQFKDDVSRVLNLRKEIGEIEEKLKSLKGGRSIIIPPNYEDEIKRLSNDISEIEKKIISLGFKEIQKNEVFLLGLALFILSSVASFLRTFFDSIYFVLGIGGSFVSGAILMLISTVITARKHEEYQNLRKALRLRKERFEILKKIIGMEGEEYDIKELTRKMEEVIDLEEKLKEKKIVLKELENRLKGEGVDVDKFDFSAEEVEAEDKIYIPENIRDIFRDLIESSFPLTSNGEDVFFRGDKINPTEIGQDFVEVLRVLRDLAEFVYSGGGTIFIYNNSTFFRNIPFSFNVYSLSEELRIKGNQVILFSEEPIPGDYSVAYRV